MKQSILATALMIASGAAAANTSIEDKLAVLQEEIEQLKLQMAQQAANVGGIQGLADRTTIGGYGELHYNRYGDGAVDKDMIDFHRFVLFFGHRFNDWISLKTEFELEHGLVKGGGAAGSGNG